MSIVFTPDWRRRYWQDRLRVSIITSLYSPYTDMGHILKGVGRSETQLFWIYVLLFVIWEQHRDKLGTLPKSLRVSKKLTRLSRDIFTALRPLVFLCILSVAKYRLWEISFTMLQVCRTGRRRSPLVGDTVTWTAVTLRQSWQQHVSTPAPPPAPPLPLWSHPQLWQVNFCLPRDPRHTASQLELKCSIHQSDFES